MSSNLTGQLFDLLQLPGNEKCADCESPNPEWASSSLGVFLCVNCVGIHRSLGVQCSITKSLALDRWTTEMYQLMESTGNTKANEKYTKNVPICWRKPDPNYNCPDFYMEEWIRAKYDRKEFMEGNSSMQRYCHGSKDGELMKKERQGNKWKPRYFRLSVETGSLSYFDKKEELTPIKRLDVRNMNIVLCSQEKTEKQNSMEIIAPEEREKRGKIKKSSRSIFVYASTAKEIVDWYLSIRSARLKVLELNPSDPMVGMILSTDRIKEGFLKKSGPKENDRYIQRWITIEPNSFAYYENKMDAVPKNEVALNSSPGYFVSEGTDGKHPDEPYQFLVSTPDRVFNFSASDESDMKHWMNAFKEAIKNEPLESNQFKRISVLSATSQLSQISVSSSDPSANS